MVELLDFFFHRFEDHAGVLTLAHDDDASHHVVFVILTDDAQTRHGADGHLGHIAHQNRCGVARGHHDTADVIGRLQQADAANGELLRTLCHVAAAGVGIAAAHGFLQVL